MIFRYDEFPVLIVRTVKSNSRKKDWLWPDEDMVGDFQINGENYAHYDYNHCDGPFCMRTLAYVRLHNENKIVVEFRTNNNLDKVQEEILRSFRLL